MRVLQRRSWAIFGASLSLVWLSHASPPVKVRLRSSWPAPNTLLEILETVTVEHEAAFFPILDLLTSPETFISSPASLTSKKVYDTAISTLVKAGYLSQPGALNTFELSLALHTASPKIEAYYEYYGDLSLSETPQTEGEAPEDCIGSWVDWYGKRVCTVQALRRLVEDSGITNSSKIHEPKLLSFDHVCPPSSGSLETPSRTAILYGNPSLPGFRPLHDYLYSLTKQSSTSVQYVFRHVPPEKLQTEPNYLSGYGVMMDLKKMDYLAVDDRKYSRGDAESSSNSGAAGGVQVEQAYNPLDVLGEVDPTVDLLTALTAEEIANISTQAAQLIMQSPEPLKALMEISQNFPKYATSLARRITVDEELETELKGNWQKLQDGFSAVWLNGMVLQNSDVTVFDLLKLLRKEREILGYLQDLGLTAPQAIEFLTHDVLISSQAGSPVTEGLFDASDRKEGGETVVWWNDIEKDSRYSRWSPELKNMLQPVFPGQFQQVRRNLFNTVLILDLSERTSLAWIVGPITNIIQRGFPFRFGVAPIVETEEGIKAARLYYYLIDTFGRSKTLSYLKTIVQSEGSGTSLDWDVARTEYDALVAGATESAQTKEDDEEPKTYLPFDEVLNGSENDENDGLKVKVEKARSYAKRLGATLKSSSMGHVFINGKYGPMTDNFLTTLQTEVAQQTQYLQEQIYLGNITDEADMTNYFYDLPTTVSRRNKYIYQSGNLKVVNIPEALSHIGLEISSSDFVYHSGSLHPAVTTWVIADFDIPSGEALLKESLLSLADSSNFRIGFIHNPSTTLKPSPGSLSYKLSKLQSLNLLNTTSSTNLLAILDESSIRSGTEEQIVLGDDISETIALLSQIDADDKDPGYRASGRVFARKFGIPAGESWILVNGRIIGPIDEGDFSREDFELLAQFELSKRVGPVVSAYTTVTGVEADAVGEKFSDHIAKLSSVVLSVQVPDPSQEGLFNVPQRPRNRRYLLMDHWKTSFSFGDNSTASHQIAFIVDPVSELASRWSPLISWLASMDSVYVQVFLNPPMSLKELPLKQFYRFSLPHRLSFDKEGSEIHPVVEFRNLPPDPIYTLGMDVPQAWLVRPHVSVHDLDNIHLASFTGVDKIEGVEAIFNLDYIVVEGHARESATNTPPRGLQVELSTLRNSTPIADTQVVANLGYVQFKVKPGVFRLEIREGYGREVYEIESVGNEGWNSPPVTSAGTEVTVTSLEGLTLYPRFKRREGMEVADVLDVPAKETGTGVMENMMASITSIFGKNKKEVEPKSDQAEINIFTVASGLLYERFASIMILSVLRNTNSTVKFWFIENFLSPSFLEFIPHFAKAYSFQYELVTYKWPSWLRAQTEKQRIIWGYKILFLDVLFPMDLKKVIFVDADQIVRADLKELVDLDLHGAPYGYTPMGDDNTEMEGFRFWKTGYWKDFLRGKPYHISALYVIDLVRFRQLAAGDRLRGSYQALSADPGSLANLDQDLPNNLQFEVPIFSLPEDWLWCETWCSKDRLDRAKTIDLCQNPMTKEPKLSRARQIPEWEEYDNEISKFAASLAEQGQIRSGAYATNVDDLANVGKATTKDKGVTEEDKDKEGGSQEVGVSETDEREQDQKREEPVVPRDEL